MSSTLRTAAKKVGGGITVVLALLVGLIAFAPSAFAHHSELVDVAATCETDADAGHSIFWRARTWPGSTDAETRYPAVIVEYRINGGAWTTAPNDTSTAPFTDSGLTTSVAGVGVFTGLGGNFTGTISIPSSASNQTVQVRSRPLGAMPAATTWFWADNFLTPPAGGDADALPDTRGPAADLTWGNGNQSTDGQESPVLTLLGGTCTPPPNPGASASTLCISGVPTIRITLSNTGGTNVTFTIASPAQAALPAFSTTKTLTPNDTTDITVDVPANEDTARTVTVTTPTGFNQSFTRTVSCQAEPAPAATVVGVCNSQTGGGTVTVDLANNNGAGGESVVLFVDATGTPVVADEAITLIGGATAQRVFNVAEGASLSVQVKLTNAAGAVIASQTGVGPLFDCTSPNPAVSEQTVCASGEEVSEGISFTLSNSGTESATFNISGGPQGIVIGPGGSDTVFLPVDEGANWSFTITATGGFSTVRSGGPLNCDNPVPSVAVSNVCAQGGVAITFLNTGDEAATFTITNNGSPTGQVITIAVGGLAQTVTVAVAEGATYSITATVPGATVTGGPIAGTRNCQNPAFGAVTLCATGPGGAAGVTVTLTNSGSEAVTVNVDHGVGNVVVPAGGAPVSVFVAQAENAAGFTLTGTSAGNPNITIPVPARNCQGLSMVVSNVCVAGGANVSVTNTGTEAAVVSVNDGPSQTIPGGESRTFFVSQAEGQSVVATATSTAGDTASTTIPARDCQRPALTGVAECAESGAVVTITNGPGASESVTVTIGAESHIIAAGTSATFTVARSEGDPATSVNATSPGNPTITVQIPARDCVEPGIPPATVAGVQTVQTAAPLAVTGVNLTLWLVLADLLLLLGVTSTFGSRFVRAAAERRDGPQG